MRRACKPVAATLTVTRTPTTDEEVVIVCLTCGCMDAHREMGEANITYEDLKRAADENGRSVEETLRTFDATVDKDRHEHSQEYEGATRPVA
jgi:hypothetical protein